MCLCVTDKGRQKDTVIWRQETLTEPETDRARDDGDRDRQSPRQSDTVTETDTVI